MNLFAIQATRNQGCEQCGAQPGWPCIPEKRALAYNIHGARLIAEHHRRQAEQNAQAQEVAK